MSENNTWREFAQYWNEYGSHHQAVQGAVAGAIGGFIAAVLIIFTLWCCLVRKPNQKKPAIIVFKEKVVIESQSESERQKNK